MSELNAAWGLALLDKFNEILLKKKKVYQIYINELKNQNVQIINRKFNHNFNYMPIIFKTKKNKELIFKELKSKKIFTRKYFYPSLNTLKHFKSKSCGVSELISSKILCLPLFEDLKMKQIQTICKVIKKYG